MSNVLPLCFKGDRSYLQGGDIYNAVGAFLLGQGKTEIDDTLMVFHKLASHQLTVSFLTDGEEIDSSAEPVAQFAYTAKNKRCKLAVCESADAINCRNPYPEETIIRPSIISLAEKTIRLEQPMPFSDIEIMTALNKELLKRLFPEMPGKWFLTRFQAKSYNNSTPYGSIQVTLEHNLNFKLTKSSLLVDDKLYGYIFFSLG